MTLVLPTTGGAAGAEAQAAPVRAATVPWGHVLPLAVVLSFANGFWIISLRGAAGAIERTSEPFSAWWHESLLVVPVYVVVVLVACAVAVRWFGPRLVGARRTVAVIGLVALAGNLAGILLLAASSAIDYRLQIEALVHMTASHGCDAACVDARTSATLDLQLKALALGAGLLAVTDVVLVTLVVAFRGGRLLVAGARPPRELRTPPPRVLLAVAVIGSASIHAAVSPEHLREWWAAGAFFMVLALAQVITALVLVSSRPSLQRPGLVAGCVTSAVPLVVWTLSRTAGLPIGPEPWQPEPVGVADVAAGLLELLALAVALALVRAHRVTRVPWTPYRLAVAVSSVVALTAIGLGASGLPGFTSFSGGIGQHHSDERAEASPS